MTNELTDRAARNNAEWCDAVCRAQGAAGEFSDDLWMTPHPTPMYYPNAVTLDNAGMQTERIRALLNSRPSGGMGIKDSYCTLDLAPLGCVIWLEAEWIYRPATLAAPDLQIDGLSWRRIASEAELIDWEAAWNSDNDEPVHIFEPSLLADNNIAFLAAYDSHDDQRIVAGGIANKTGDEVGISNIFTPEDDAQAYWASFTRAVMDLFAGYALVGYERDDDLEIAHKLGFQSVGALRVWGKPANSG